MVASEPLKWLCQALLMRVTNKLCHHSGSSLWLDVVPLCSCLKLGCLHTPAFHSQSDTNTSKHKILFQRTVDATHNSHDFIDKTFFKYLFRDSLQRCGWHCPILQPALMLREMGADMGRLQPLRCLVECMVCSMPPGLVSHVLTSCLLLFCSTTSRWKGRCCTGWRWRLSSRPPAIESPPKSSPQLPRAGCCW